ncbi:MAG: hypothetical protein ABEJ42_06615 [Halobacteriaceae archaeon]
MERAISPVIGVLAMVIVTILLASMFAVTFPDVRVWDLQWARDVDRGDFRPDGGAGGGVPAVVYTDERGTLHAVAPGGAVRTYSPVPDQGDWNAEAIGPLKRDLDGDGRLEVPYVDGQNDLVIIDAANESDVLVSDAGKRHLAVGEWGNATLDTETSVFYVDNGDGNSYRYTPGDPSGERNELAVDAARNVKAVAGVADYDGDGDADVVFVDNDGHPAYFDDGAVHRPGVHAVGNSAPYGVGEPRDMDGDGRVRLPSINPTRGENVVVVSEDGDTTALAGADYAKKAPVVAIDWTGDDRKEVVFVDEGQELSYVTLDGTRHVITGPEGDPIEADADQGTG